MVVDPALVAYVAKEQILRREAEQWAIKRNISALVTVVLGVGGAFVSADLHRPGLFYLTFLLACGAAAKCRHDHEEMTKAVSREHMFAQSFGANLSVGAQQPHGASADEGTI